MLEEAKTLFTHYHERGCEGWLVVSTLWWWLGLLPVSLGAACGAWVGFFWMLRQLCHLSLRFSSPCASAAHALAALTLSLFTLSMLALSFAAHVIALIAGRG